MEKRRWLLPFTQGIDSQTVSLVVRTAASHNADLVPVSLMNTASGLCSSGTHLVHNAQAKSFLSLVKKVANRYEVPVECHNVYTHNVESNLATLKHNLSCDNIVIVLDKQQSVLLPTSQVKSLQKKYDQAKSLLFVRLPEQEQREKQVGVAASFSSLVRRLRNQRQHTA